MKKLFIFAALAFGLVSCQNDTNIFGIEVTPDEKPVEYTISVGIPELDQTRAGYTNSGEGAIANGVLDDTNVTLRYILGVYIWDASELKYKLAGSHHTEYSDNCTVNFKPTLVPNRKYNFVVWVDIVTKVDGEWVNALYNVNDLAAVTMDADKWLPMDEKRDAFTGFTSVDNITASVGTPTSPITVNCTRPFGKLRVITEDMVALKEHKITPSYVEVTYNEVPTYSFNATDGTYTRAATTLAKSHGRVAIANYETNTTTNKALFTDYFFAPKEQVSLGVFTMTVYEADSDSTIITTTNFPTDIPVKRNTLTTITGNFLTLQDVNLQVNVENNGSFTGEDGVKGDNNGENDDEITKEL